MRWLFPDPEDREEAARRAEVLGRIDAWWQAFMGRTRELDDLFHNRSQWDLPDWMRRTLQAIDQNLMWEFTTAVRGHGHRLVITPEMKRHLRPLVQTILQRAPAIEGWEFHAYRLAEDIEMARQTVQARTSGDISRTQFRAQVGLDRTIDLTFSSQTCQSADDSQALNDAFVAAETLLGEEVLDKWIGVVEVAPTAKEGLVSGLLGQDPSPERLLPLESLQPTVGALISSLVEQLPDRPIYEYEELHSWHPGEGTAKSADSDRPRLMGAVFKLQPAPDRAEYPGRSDLRVASTGWQELWQAMHSRRLFHSSRFSRHGETFCYVKLDGRDMGTMERFPDRVSMEEALDEALVPSKAGCTVGGGTGLWYSYIDLALADMHRGIDIVRRVLAAGAVPQRSWILFFEPDLAAEWVGLYPDTPPPPSEATSQ